MQLKKIQWMVTIRFKFWEMLKIKSSFLQLVQFWRPVQKDAA